MSYYESKYTGEDIDFYIDFIRTIKQWVKVWGCVEAPQTGVNFKDIKINPDTNDRTGFYKIISADDASDLTTNDPNAHKGGVGALVTHLEVCSEDNHSMGTTSGWVGPYDEVETVSTDVGGGVINVSRSSETEPHTTSGVVGQTRYQDLYIHEIWRYQTYLKSDIC